jgi:hypothetical protein
MIFFASGSLLAKEITIIYTGETHAMIYPCSCPKEPDGGVARRSTLIKQLKKDNPDALLLDSGGFFAGGLLDEYTQNTQLDSARSIVNLKAMELMKYDVLSIGDDEFNFGSSFLQENIDKTNLTFLSCNLAENNFGGKLNYVKPYIIKEIQGTKIGIIGATSQVAMQKVSNLKFIEPKAAVANVIRELKEKGANIIVLLSHLGESEDLNLINDIQGIDILITGHSYKEGPSLKIGNTLVLKPTWQGRKLDKATLTFKDNKIVNYQVENLRLSEKNADDPGILPILPACFSNANCKKENSIGTCNNAGSLNASCSFSQVNKINLLVITSKTCITCLTETTVNYLKSEFPGLIVKYSYYPDSSSSRQLIKDNKISGLPVYLLGQEVEKEKNFDRLKKSLEKKNDFYMLKPEMGGLSYFINRKKIKGKLDLFISLYDKNTKELLEVIKEFNPVIHFLAIETQEGSLDAARGVQEVEEILRSVCIQQYYPENFWNYISCRAGNINSSWWENCLEKNGSQIIKVCAQGQEGRGLLKKDISLNGELQVMFGPTYLMDNQEIFTSNGVPTKEELAAILKR